MQLFLLLGSVAVCSSLILAKMPDTISLPSRRGRLPSNPTTFVVQADPWFLGALVGGSAEFLLPTQLVRAIEQERGLCMRPEEPAARACEGHALPEPGFVLLADGGLPIAGLLTRLFQPAREDAVLPDVDPDEEALEYRMRLYEAGRQLRSCYHASPLLIVPPFMPLREPPSDARNKAIWETAVALTRRYAQVADEVAKELTGRVVIIDLPWEDLRTPVSWVHLGIRGLAPAGTYHLANQIARVVPTSS